MSCLITFTSDLTYAKPCPPGDSVLPFARLQHQRLDWGGLCSQVGCTKWLRGESGKLGSGVASRALAAAEGLVGGSESSVVVAGQIRFAVAGLPCGPDWLGPEGGCTAAGLFWFGVGFGVVYPDPPS